MKHNYQALVLGTQWGDEGKGKLTDILANKAEYVVRYQGGNNAGHTVVVGDETYKLHLLPSGVVYGKKCLIGSGVVLDPVVVLEEIGGLKKRGIEVNLMIDPYTSIIMPYHKLMDGISEKSLKSKKIGTTKRGIGPCYEDKYGRRGIRMVDLINNKILTQKLTDNYKLKKKIAEKVYGQKLDLNLKKMISDYLKCGKNLKKYIGDVSETVYKALEQKKNVLFESAQGTFLDITYGTYPYVTSSHPLAGAVFSEVGIGPREINVYGVVKAYTTRVGEGPFLTELKNKTGEKLVEQGHEFGTTTGRKRRCGWLDLVMVNYAKRLNGLDSLVITKLDCLSGIKKLKVGVEYLRSGKRVNFPLTIDEISKSRVSYREFEGFEIDENTKKYEELPKNARTYLEFIEKYTNTPISMISIGPKRSQTILRA